MTQDDTHALLDRARSGDRGAFDELCERERAQLEPLIRSQMGHLVRAKLEPADILQETFLRAFQSISVFRGRDEKTFFKWLTSIAEHLIWNASQKRSLKEVPLAFDASGGVSPSRELRRKERLERLEKSLSGLKPDQREAITLSKIDGLTVKAIAERMGRSEAAVRQLLSRSLRELRRTFGDTESLHLPERGLEGRADPLGCEAYAGCP